VKAGEISVTSYRGNEIKKTGDEESPAVHIERPGNDVVKKASELNIEEKSSGGGETEEKEGDKEVVEQNGEAKEKEDEAKVGEKRKIDEEGDADDKDDGQKNGDEGKVDEKDVKKQKIDDDSSKEAKKGPGRPKANGEKKPATKKEKKAPAVGKTERKTRSQGAV
jgi:hypothetical protein